MMMKSITEIITSSMNNMWPMLTIFLVIVASVRIAAILSSGEKFIFHKEFGNLLFIVYILLLYEMLTRSELNHISGYNLVPFTEILRYKVGTTSFYINVIGNIVVFIPFGYFISRYIKPKKILPLCIGRSFDVDDIILNAVGALIGFLFYVALNATKKYLPGIFEKDIIYNIICFLILIIIIIYILSCMGVKIWS